MAKLRAKVWLICLVLPGILAAFSGDIWGANFEDVPVKAMVTMIDLGATSCLPCKLMAPVVEKLEKEYREKAAIVFIDA